MFVNLWRASQDAGRNVRSGRKTADGTIEAVHHDPDPDPDFD